MHMALHRSSFLAGSKLGTSVWQYNTQSEAACNPAWQNAYKTVSVALLQEM